MVWKASSILLLSGFLVADPGPDFHNEKLQYSLNWPSGLSLGEAQMQAEKVAPDRWEAELKLDGSLPGVPLRDRFRSVATSALCSIEFEKTAEHGPRKTREKTEFDAERGTATRTTVGGGGKSEFPIAPCARDALALLYHLRRELAKGRVPPPGTAYFGSAYQVRFEYGGARTLRIGEQPMEADRVTATFKGPSSQASFEMYFARDAARTLLAARIPLSMGVFSLEIVR